MLGRKEAYAIPKKRCENMRLLCSYGDHVVSQVVKILGQRIFACYGERSEVYSNLVSLRAS